MNPKDLVVWLRVKDDAAVLKRVVTDGDSKSLLLIVKDRTQMDFFAERALRCGMKQIADKGLFRTEIQKTGRPTVTVRDIAAAIGAEIFPLRRDVMMGPDYTINTTSKAQKAKADQEFDIADLIRIGVNNDGEDVLSSKDRRARFVARGRYDGKIEYVRFQDGFFSPSAFLIVRKESDLDAIGAAALAQARKGTLHKTDFEEILTNAVFNKSWDDIGVPEASARLRIATAMLRQVGEVALQDDRSRESFKAAIRVSSAINYTVTEELAASEVQGFKPSPVMTAFLRRITRDFASIDFKGNDILAAAMPRSRKDVSAYQLHDFTTVQSENLIEKAESLLLRREAEGVTTFILSGNASDQAIEDLRYRIGLKFALEITADVTSAVASGIQDQSPITLLSVGAARPEALEALPQAANRVFTVFAPDDLLSLEREIQRSRLRIRDFNRGAVREAEKKEDTREENIRQRPYTPLSRATEPFTMIPVAFEGATSMALDRVRRDFEPLGGVDAVVSYSLRKSIAEIGAMLTAEQVDAVALRIHAAFRDRGMLIADQTGIGKGRTLAAVGLGELSGLSLFIENMKKKSEPEAEAVEDATDAAEAETAEPAGEEADIEADDADTDAESLPRNGRKRILYFTDSGSINIPDVMRDFVGVGLKPVDVQSKGAFEGETKVAFLSNGSVFEVQRTDPETGIVVEDKIVSLKPAAKSKVMKEGVWPEGAEIVVTTYSTFNFREGDAKEAFFDALDDDTFVIFDESHIALNPKSNIGRNVRRIIREAGPANTCFGTATFARSSHGLDLYKPLLPPTVDAAIFADIEAGGEVALESFSTMLAKDGVMIRRDHDHSGVEFKMTIPTDEEIEGYRKVQDLMAPIYNTFIENSVLIGTHVGRASALMQQQAIANGMSVEDARAMTNELNQYSVSPGSPISALSSMTINALRVELMAKAVIEELEEGRKPQIIFQSTNESLLKDLCRDEDGRFSQELFDSVEGLTLRDQMHRIHERIYMVKVNGERQDTRLLYPEVQAAFEVAHNLINQMPANMPVSPIDALIERIEAEGHSVGEISGRTLCYRNGRLQKRNGRNRRETGKAYNDGDLDVLVFNGAGAVGGSFHAAPDAKDQRPRTIFEFESMADPLKGMQAFGRGNRYMQTSKPRVHWVMLGLVAEMRLAAARNNKVRLLGASVDGNRSHPLLVDGAPDVLNRVGDEAAKTVLISSPSLARRLGFMEFSEANRDATQGVGNDEFDESSMSASMTLSLANKVMIRAESVTSKEQEELFNRIVIEFEALVEELDSRNANPLRPKRLEGEIEIRDTTIFKGQERDLDDLDVSAFTSPLYLQTAIHKFNEAAWSGEKLMSEIESAQRLYGTEGLAPWAERIRQNLGNLMRPYLPEGYSIEEALERPEMVGAVFAARHKRFTDLEWLLENMKPGVELRFPSDWDHRAELSRVIVGVSPPRHPSMFDTPAAYSVKAISAGDVAPQTYSLSRLIRENMEAIRINVGLSEGVNENFLSSFDEQALMTRQVPVQILTGNILSAMQEGRRHSLGTIQLYEDTKGMVHRGVVVSRNKIDLSKLPVNLPSGIIAVEAAQRFLQDTTIEMNSFRIYLSMDPTRTPERSQEEDGIISVSRSSITIDFIALRKSNYEFFTARPGLYEVVMEKPLPSEEDIRARMGRTMNHKPVKFRTDTEEGMARMNRFLRLLGETPMITNGYMRSVINEAELTVNRIREGVTLMGATLPHDIEGTAHEIEQSQDPEPADEHEPAVVALEDHDDEPAQERAQFDIQNMRFEM